MTRIITATDKRCYHERQMVGGPKTRPGGPCVCRLCTAMVWGDAMCVADIMITNPITVGPADSVGTAVRRMRRCGYRCLPVVEGTRLVGIVTDYDLNRAANSPLVAREPWHDHFLLDLIDVGSCMQRNPRTVAPDTHIREAARLMYDSGSEGVAVVRDRTLVGLVTIPHLLQHLISLLGD